MLETPENKSPEEKMTPKLEALYSQVPGWENILVSVKEGREKFNADLQANGLERFGLDTSKVHDYSDIETQAFILGIPSKENPEEISTKSYLTYGAHWIDDFFDNSNLGVQDEKLFDDRRDIKKVLNNLDKVGQVGFFLTDKVPNPEGVYKGLGRILYGGLVQRSHSKEQREMLVREYQDLGIKNIDNHIAEEIKQIQPEVYWMTNKTVIELINSSESFLNFTVQELWNLIYTPALYYHDIAEEEKSGESSFDKKERPRIEEMIKMIKIGAKHLSEFPDEKLDLRMEQLRFLLTAFRKVLPDQIISEYELIVSSA